MEAKNAHSRCGAARSRLRRFAWLILAPGALFAAGAAAQAATTLNPALLPGIEAATFEVVAAKPKDTVTYAQPLPLDLLPYQERTDKYFSIGTAFEIAPNRFVTAAHVLLTGNQSLWGPPELRDSAGKVYAIDQIEKFALRRDFVVFSLVAPPTVRPLPVDTRPTLNQAVYSVGNALGTGVVIRNGLYTSNTPENQDGRWKWIRFSAPASPGNSGGPLLDQDGKVIGVVLMKSPNENLNYALPIGEVLSAPADLARLHKRMSTTLPISHTAHVGTLSAQFALPKTLPEFFAAYAGLTTDFVSAQIKATLAQQAAELFPQGQGARRVLNGGAPKGDLPRLLVRNAGTWAAVGKAFARTPLAANGYVLVGKGPDKHPLLAVRRPDTDDTAQFYHDPRTVMDLLLSAGFFSRTIANDKVKATSFGEPTHAGLWTDRWGRHWQIWAWPVSHFNRYYIVAALPTPEGYAMLLEVSSAGQRQADVDELQALTDFVSVSYEGTLAQWKTFLTLGKLLPAAVADLHIGFDYGKDFHYDSGRIDFAFSSAVQKIAPDSALWLGMTFYPPDQAGQVVWDASAIEIAAGPQDQHAVAVVRHAPPPANLDANDSAFWQRLVARKPPFNAVAFDQSDTTEIQAVVAPAGGADPRLLYTLSLRQPGTQTQATMTHALDPMLRHFKVKAG